MMGSILSSKSNESDAKREDSTLIEMNHETTAKDRNIEDQLKIKECPNCPTDPIAFQFVQTFRELQGQKENFYIQLHSEVIQWRLMFQRGVSNRFKNNERVNMLIREFIRIHEKLDEFLEEERKSIEKILPKRKVSVNTNCNNQKKSKKKGVIQEEKESLELTPEAMQRLMCFQECNDQHIRILIQVLSDIDDCKTFAASVKKQSTEETTPSEASSKPISITVSSDANEN